MNSELYDAYIVGTWVFNILTWTPLLWFIVIVIVACVLNELKERFMNRFWR